MARAGLLLGFAALGGLVLADRARRRAAPIPPAAPGFPGGPPPSVTPAIPTSPSNVAPAPAVSKPPEPKHPAAAPKPTPGMAVSVTLPLGWRRLDPNEWTPDLHDTVNQVMAAGFPVGTFAPFDLAGVHYAVLVEQDETGLQNVAIAVDEGVPEPT